MDIRKIELTSAAKLSFDVKFSGSAAKFFVYYKDAKGKMVTVKALTKGFAASASTKQAVLNAGVYYIAMKSTKAQKGDEVYYDVSVNKDSVFYSDGDNWTNDYVSKTKSVSAAVGNYVAQLEAGKTLQIDGVLDPGAAPLIDHNGFTNFVGTGDVSDVVRINAVAGMKLSLKVTATDAVSLVIYGLQNNGTLKALKTVKSKNNIAELNDFELKAKSAPGGQFFVGVSSTNAKKGSAAYYNVDVVSVSGSNASLLDAPESAGLTMPETDALGISDAMSFGGYDTDALADASASALAGLDDKSAWQNLLA